MKGNNRKRAAGALLVARPASERLRLTAATQLDQIVISGAELIVAATDARSALGTALALRRWGSNGAADQPSIGVAVRDPPNATDGDDLRRARELAATAAPRQILVDAAFGAVDELPWSAAEPDGVVIDSEALELRWAGPEADESAGLPLPGPLSSALDRPWAMLGRGVELDEIATAWSRAVAGDRTTLLIAGEPGAGKSRLVAEAGREVKRAGGLVLHGSGEGDGGAPYAPFAAALAHLDRHADGARLGALRESLFGRLIPGAETGGPQRPSGSLGDERGPLFSSAVEQLERLARRSPILLIIEDLQGCGLSSLLLLEHLTRTGAQLPMMVLATYRTTDLEPSDERARVIAALRSAPGARHTELAGLETGALRGIAAALGVAADAAGLEHAAQVTHRETNGNPLLACEVLRTMGRSGQAGSEQRSIAAPRSLRMLIASRAHDLGTDAYAQISAAAVAGRSFDPGVVATALAVAPTSFAESMALAERTGLISIEPADGSCTFTHALTARCLYEEVGPARRGRLHRRLAEVLEQQGDGGEADRIGQLARHWRRADPPDDQRAARLCAIAGARALERYDNDAAAGWFEQALQLRDRSHESDEHERCDLLIGLGTALRCSGQGRYREILLEAARLADALDDVDRLAEATLANHRGFVSLVGGFDRERGALLERAAERMTERSSELALVLAQLAIELTFSPQRERRRRLAEQALEVARECGDRRVVSRVLIRYLIARWGPENPRERITDAAESIAISSELDEPLDLFHGLHWQAVAQIEIGRIEDAARTLREQERIASRIGDSTATWLCECVGSIHLSLRGDLAAAEARAQRAAELAQQSSQPDALPFYISQLASIRWQQGRLPELAPLLADVIDQHPGLPAFRSLVTLAHALAGERDFAREVLGIDAANGFSELPRDPVWIAGAVTYAHAIVELSDRDAAARIHPMIEPYRGQLASTSISIWGLVDHALGRLELLLGDEVTGRASLGAAIAEYGRISAPVWRAQAGLDLANGSGGSADDELERAELIANAHSVGLRTGAALLVASGAMDGAAEPGSALGERIARLRLTKRQAEVLELVARGSTNAQIAAEMQVSVSTVKRHLENIFDRTDVRSRGVLTALLLDDEGKTEA